MMMILMNCHFGQWPENKKSALIKSRRGGTVALAVQRINLLARPQDTRRIQNAKLVKCHFRFQVGRENSRGQKAGCIVVGTDQSREIRRRRCGSHINYHGLSRRRHLPKVLAKKGKMGGKGGEKGVKCELVSCEMFHMWRAMH